MSADVVPIGIRMLIFYKTAAAAGSPAAAAVFKQIQI